MAKGPKAFLDFFLASEMRYRGAVQVEEKAGKSGPDSWSILLARLARDGAEAAREYERIRGVLGDFFRRRGAAEPEALSDRVFDRLSAKLAEGVEVDDPGRYALGIARFVLLEAVKTEVRERRALRDPRAGAPEWDAAERERYLSALETCLEALEEAERTRVLRYHQSAGRERIHVRQKMAAELTISLNSLRIRMHRARQRLEDCVRNKLSLKEIAAEHH